jgi:hypothetical protein
MSGGGEDAKADKTGDGGYAEQGAFMAPPFVVLACADS